MRLVVCIAARHLLGQEISKISGKWGQKWKMGSGQKCSACMVLSPYSAVKFPWFFTGAAAWLDFPGRVSLQAWYPDTASPGGHLGGARPSADQAFVFSRG